MKFMSVLLISCFFLVSCGKKQVKSLAEEQVSSSSNAESLVVDLNFDESQKYSLAVVIEDDVPKCQFSLEGKFESIPSFAEVYPLGDPVYSKKLIASEKAKNMTEEELANVIVVPNELASLPDCDTDEVASVAQLVPNMILANQEEEVAGIVKFAVMNSISCVTAYMFTSQFSKWYLHGLDEGWDVVVGVMGFFGTASILWPTPPTDIKYAVGALLCGAAGTKTGLAFLSEGTKNPHKPKK